MEKHLINKRDFLLDSILPEDIFIPEDLNDDQKLFVMLVTEFVEGEIFSAV